MSVTITPAELAETVNSDGKTVRKFLRSITPKEDQPGKGSRWAIDGSKRSLTKLQKQFATWNQAQLEERAARAAQRAQDAAAQVTEDEVDETELDDE
jgi:hypothetical protein